MIPWHGREQKIDPTKSITSWRSAWRSIRKSAGLTDLRFHDLRHTAITMLAEKGTPDWIIMAQVGHVSPAMLKTYSHIRRHRQALNQAAATLQPTFRTTQPEDARAEFDELAKMRRQRRVTSRITSQRT